jgi:hypothetical protein
MKLTEVLLHRLRFSFTLTEFFINLTEVFLTPTAVFPCVFLSCKANARVKLAKTLHGSHSPTLFVICVVRLLFVLFCVLFVCKCVLPPGDNPTAGNTYIRNYHIRKAAVSEFERTERKCSIFRYVVLRFDKQIFRQCY